ncbi:cre-kcc-1 protein [Lasius niger]|uniref:Cre-kcc-1 protein n=1 Tax=Lasius niger TaxID=67767 RepID=A0A0J7MTC3_LASNI|nr:cre-kcc-1 protein [Lasius niger]
MAEYKEDGKDNETSTTDVDDKTSEECNEEYNPTSVNDNEMDKTSTMVKKEKIREPMKLLKVHEKVVYQLSISIIQMT